MNYSEFAVGDGMNYEMSDHSVLITGKNNPDYSIRLEPEDEATIIFNNGEQKTIIYTFVEDNCLVTKDNEYVELKRLIFVGK